MKLGGDFGGESVREGVRNLVDYIVSYSNNYMMLVDEINDRSEIAYQLR
jgi:hypothetical protein